MFVTDGGVLEIHGKPKLSWTKLTQTASKLSEDSIYVDLKVNKRVWGEGGGGGESHDRGYKVDESISIYATIVFIIAKSMSSISAIGDL